MMGKTRTTASYAVGAGGLGYAAHRLLRPGSPVWEIKQFHSLADVPGLSTESATKLLEALKPVRSSGDVVKDLSKIKFKRPLTAFDNEHLARQIVARIQEAATGVPVEYPSEFTLAGLTRMPEYDKVLDPFINSFQKFVSQGHAPQNAFLYAMAEQGIPLTERGRFITDIATSNSKELFDNVITKIHGKSTVKFDPSLQRSIDELYQAGKDVGRVAETLRGRIKFLPGAVAAGLTVPLLDTLAGGDYHPAAAGLLAALPPLTLAGAGWWIQRILKQMPEAKGLIGLSRKAPWLGLLSGLALSPLVYGMASGGK